MIIEPTGIDDLLTLRHDPHLDERGSFDTLYDRDGLRSKSLAVDFAAVAIARNPRAGTLRGLHYQRTPYCEIKIVHCLRGRVWDVVLDVRRSSSTFGAWRAFELSGDTPLGLYIGRGLAHGYLTLTDTSDLHYLLSENYAPGYTAGVRWNDERLRIDWPGPPIVISDRDRGLPHLEESIDPFA
jgi:dTDP-4-dehydrorhamnose 3,5-epimerase